MVPFIQSMLTHHQKAALVNSPAYLGGGECLAKRAVALGKPPGTDALGEGAVIPGGSSGVPYFDDQTGGQDSLGHHIEDMERGAFSMVGLKGSMFGDQKVHRVVAEEVLGRAAFGEAEGGGGVHARTQSKRMLHSGPGSRHEFGTTVEGTEGPVARGQRGGGSWPCIHVLGGVAQATTVATMLAIITIILTYERGRNNGSQERVNRRK